MQALQGGQVQWEGCVAPLHFPTWLHNLAWPYLPNPMQGAPKLLGVYNTTCKDPTHQISDPPVIQMLVKTGHMAALGFGSTAPTWLSNFAPSYLTISMQGGPKLLGIKYIPHEESTHQKSASPVIHMSTLFWHKGGPPSSGTPCRILQRWWASLWLVGLRVTLWLCDMHQWVSHAKGGNFDQVSLVQIPNPWALGRT